MPIQFHNYLQKCTKTFNSSSSPKILGKKFFKKKTKKIRARLQARTKIGSI